MPRRRIILADEAGHNVQAIYDWIAERSTDGATRWYQTFTKTIETIANDAARFGIAPESRHFPEEVRNATFRMRSGRTYRVLYRIEGDHVHVLFVRAPGQDEIAS